MPPTVKDKAASLPEPVATADFDAALAKIGVKDRSNILRYLETGHGGNEARAALWKRIFCVMSELAPHAVRTGGQLAVQFFVADGKHRLQIFALEDAKTAGFNLYVSDCTAKAIANKLLGPGTEVNDVMSYPVRGADGVVLHIETLSAASTINAAEFYKHMLGWNRKAIRIALPETASEAEIRAAEGLCVLGAAQLKPKQA